MANEITARTLLNVNKGGSSVNGDVTSTLTLTGSGMYTATQAIGTSEEIVSFPADLVTEGVGLIWIYNLDLTNFVTLKIKVAGTTYPFAKLKAGDPPVCFRTNAAAASDPALWVQADTASCNIRVVASGT